MPRATYLAPGVYVEEIPSAQQPIAGVGTNTVGFIGVVPDQILYPEDVLQGELRGQRPSLPISTLQPGRLQSMGEFWQAVGGKPKAALNYQVTLSVDVAAPEEVRLVTEKVIKIRMEHGEKAR